MALTINTNIKNDADGYLLDADAVKVREGVMLPEAMAEKQNKAAVVQEIPLSGIFAANTMYYIGLVEEDVSVSAEDGTNLGDMLYWQFSTGDTVPAIEFTGSNTVGLEDIDFTVAESIYELMAMWNGAKWAFVYKIYS